MKITQLSELAEQYDYNKIPDILRSDSELLFNPKHQQLFLKNYFHFHDLSNSGDCRELMYKAHLDITTIFPEIHVMRARGRDNVYFSHKKSDHYFLLFFDKKPTEENIVTKKRDIKNILSHNPVLFDPALGFVSPFSESYYAVTKLINQGVREMVYNSQPVSRNFVIPLYLDKSGILVEFGASPRAHEYYVLSFKQPYGLSNAVELYHHDIESFLSNKLDMERFWGVYTTLKQKKIISSYESLDSKNPVILG